MAGDKVQYVVTLFIEGDTDPAQIAWAEYAKEQGFTLGDDPDEERRAVQVRSFPWSDVYHEVRWFILRPLSFDEWSALDDAESDVLSRIVGDDKFSGIAGPIPGTGRDRSDGGGDDN